MLRGISTLVLLYSLVISSLADNTSSGNAEVIPVVNRFSPEGRLVNSGRQVFRDISEQRGLAKVPDTFYEEYLYDDGVSVAKPATEAGEMTPAISTRTTVAVQSSSADTEDLTTETPAESTEMTEPVTTTFTTVETTLTSGAFATLLVHPVPFHTEGVPTVAHELTTVTTSPKKASRLKDGDVFHLKQDSTAQVEDLPLKLSKKPDWRRIWKSLRPKKRTLVSNTVGVEQENLPPPPPGAILIEIRQVRGKRATNKQRRSTKPFDYPDAEAVPLPLTDPLLSDTNQSFLTMRVKFDLAQKRLDIAEEDEDLQDVELPLMEAESERNPTKYAFLNLIPSKTYRRPLVEYSRSLSSYSKSH